MPHLTGIIITNKGREALFETRDDQSIADVLEGDGVDGFKVVAISADCVTLRCGSEIYCVSPTPDPSYRAAMIASQPRLPTPVSVQQTQADNDK